MNHLQDTICAIATPPGQGGIGVVRISGTEAINVLEKIWDGKVPASSFKSHRLYYGRIKDDLEIIDVVFSVWMKSPHSYTGEHVVEISCHGGPAILNKIIKSCLSARARLAEPGEFTKRAFLNGKMDLAQAEAVADLIAAASEQSCRLARQQLDGHLSQKIQAILNEVTSLRAFVEATIDFPEEDIEFITKEKIKERLADLAKGMISLADTYHEGRLLRDGVRVSIVGKPNVGKSSLFNALVGEERAIVHHTSGTTRDLVTETVQIEGVAFHVTDAAGLWDASHEVEKIGIEKTYQAIKQADVILFVVDGSQPIDKNDENIFKDLDRGKTLVCINKSDLVNPPIPPLEKGGEGGFEDSAIKISALRGDGIDQLKKGLVQLTQSHGCQEGLESILITSARHKEALDEAIKEVKCANSAVTHGESAEFVAHHLFAAHEALGRITGKVSTEEILDHIFSRFCIGK
jgi:tRNA modification GTPase